MDEREWLVTLTFRTTVRGVASKDEAVYGAIEQIKRDMQSGSSMPVRVEARKKINLTEEEHLFGVQWR